MAPAEEVGTAITTFSGFLFLTDLAAANMVKPEANPSSTSMTNFPPKSGKGLSPLYLSILSRIIFLVFKIESAIIVSVRPRCLTRTSFRTVSPSHVRAPNPASVFQGI